MPKPKRRSTRTKKGISDLLREAITGIYREGRDTEATVFELYTLARAEIATANNSADANFFSIDEELVEEKAVAEISKAQKDLNDIEKRIGVYLFAKILTEEDPDGMKLETFIADAKERGKSLYKEIARLREEGKKKNQIVTFLRGELKEIFTAILLDRRPEI